MSENEEFYDKEIAPALLELCKKCEERGIGFIAQVEYQPGDFGRTANVPKDAHMAMKMLHMCALARDNVDAYVIGLGRYAQENGVSYDQSMVMNMMLKPKSS